MRLKFIVSYDGTPFSGWQSQPSGKGVQDLIEKAFLQIVGKRVLVHGAGRTDAGVHALGQCAHVDVPDARIDSAIWRRALNANLPREIRILKTYQTDLNFHARFSAIGKIYRYRIWNSDVVPPLECNRVWQVISPLDFNILRSSAVLFEGRHNFASFSANGRKSRSDSVRTIRRIRITRQSANEIRLTFEGEGFLYKMVRMLTGALVRMAQGKEAAVSHLLAFPTATKKNRYVAPACGLYLVRVLYASEIFKTKRLERETMVYSRRTIK